MQASVGDRVRACMRAGGWLAGWLGAVLCGTHWMHESSCDQHARVCACASACACVRGSRPERLEWVGAISRECVLGFALCAFWQVYIINYKRAQCMHHEHTFTTHVRAHACIARGARGARTRGARARAQDMCGERQMEETHTNIYRDLRWSLPLRCRQLPCPLPIFWW